MAIRWLKDIGVIKRVLAEAETSARLVAIRSLELMLDDKALEVLEESHANAISFEKFFIEKAIQNINDHKKTGLVPVELQKAFEKQERLQVNLANSVTTESSSENEVDQIDLGDLESTLIQSQSQSSYGLVVDANETEINDLIGEITEDSTTPLEIRSTPSEVEQDSHTQLDDSNETSVNSDNLDSELKEMVTEDNSEDIEDLLSPQNGKSETLDDNDFLSLESDNEQIDTDTYGDLLPPMNSEGMNTAAESFEDLLPSMHSDTSETANDSYEDLLPPLNSNSVTEDYDDLLPPLQEVEGSNVSTESFDDLLPPMQASANEFQGSEDLNSFDLEDNLEDLLPAMREANVSNKSDEELLPFDEGGNFEDLLPPLNGLEKSNDNLNDLLPVIGSSSDYDDLLPPQSSDDLGGLDDSDYDDLLPPLASSVGTGASHDDFLQADGWEQETGDGDDSYDDLLPPLKKV